MRNIPEFFVSRNFLNDFFTNLYTHIGWSENYRKYVVVEPICWFEIKEGKITSCNSVDEFLYPQEHIGNRTAVELDEKKSDFIEQALVEENNYLLVSDNPILFPFERTKKFLKKILESQDLIREIGGLIHYHINEKSLSNQDITTYQKFTKRVIKEGGNNQLGLVLNQQNPIGSIKLSFRKKERFVKNLFQELNKGRITVQGLQFSEKEPKKIKIFLES